MPSKVLPLVAAMNARGRKAVVEESVEAMFYFVAKRSPLALFIGSFAVNYFNGGVGCPNVADAINHLKAALIRSRRAVFTDNGKAPVHLVPDDRNWRKLWGRSAARQKENEKKSHKQMLSQTAFLSKVY